MANKELNLKFLDYAGFNEQEAQEILPEWLEATERLGLTDENVRYAVEEFLPECWDLQYLGVRKMIGAMVHELIDLTQTPKMKAEGKKILYGILPALLSPYTALKYAGGDDIYVAFPDFMLITGLNSIFRAAAPILDLAEEANFTYGCRHCPLNKARYAGFMSGIIPAPDVVWSFGFVCDEGPHTDQMIQCALGEEWKYVVSRYPHDSYFGEKDEENVERIKYIAGVLKHDMEEVCGILGIAPSPEDMQRAIDDSNRVMGKVAQINMMVSLNDPAPLRAFEAAYTQLCFGAAFNNGFKYMEEALDILIPELEQAIAEGKGVLPKGATRVGAYYTPFVHPWVDKMFMDNGCITVMSEMSAPTTRLMTPLVHTEDPYMAMAESWLRLTSGVNLGQEIEDQAEKVSNSNVDGVYMGFFDYDRWLGAHQKLLAEEVEKKTGIPHFYVEGDFYDSRDYGEEALRTRIESISQIITMKKNQKKLAGK